MHLKYIRFQMLVSAGCSRNPQSLWGSFREMNLMLIFPFMRPVEALMRLADHKQDWVRFGKNGFEVPPENWTMT